MSLAYVFEEAPNPSSDYYILPFLNAKGLDVRRISIYSDYPPIEKDSSVFVVRYLNRRLIKHIKTYRDNIAKLVYFMDDGLWDLKAISSVPLLYAWRLFRKAYVYKKDILELKAEVWVSTKYLQEKYSKHNPKLIHPYPIGLEDPKVSESTQKVVFYHVTSSHKEEFLWLKELFQELSKEVPSIILEIVLDDKLWKTFKGIKNLVPIRPMKWESFYKFSSLKYRTLGLAPLFDNEFNRGRSWIKFYDITRSGAVGIYSELAPYSSLIKEFKAGVVLPMDRKLWLEAIKELTFNEDYRRSLFENAKALVEYLKGLWRNTSLS